MKLDRKQYLLAAAGCAIALLSGVFSGCTLGSTSSVEGVEEVARANAASDVGGFAANCESGGNGSAYVTLAVKNDTGFDLNQDYQKASSMAVSADDLIPAGGSGTVRACIWQTKPLDLNYSGNDQGQGLRDNGQSLDIQYVNAQGNAYNIHLEQTAWTEAACTFSEECVDKNVTATVSATWAYNKMPNPNENNLGATTTVDLQSNTADSPATLAITL